MPISNLTDNPIVHIIRQLKNRWQKAQIALAPTTEPCLYHYERKAPGERSRIHLRIDPDGSGVLLINANRVVHLNPTAALMAKYILDETPEPLAVQQITNQYQVNRNQAKADYINLRTQIAELVRPDGACPVHDLDVEITAPFSARPSAPYRMDLAVTYRCNNDCTHCYNARPRDYPEMTTDQWKSIIERIWELGIPHVVFTGGEPTLRNDLPELVAHAQQTGLVTGLNTNGRRLCDAHFVQSLVDAGLDHVQITVESCEPEIHDRMVNLKGAWSQTVAGIRNVLDTPLFVMTNTTMLRDNIASLPETLDFLAEIGVPTIGLNALIYSGKGLTVGSGLYESELAPLLELARERIDAHKQRLIWYTPTEYCHFDPMQLELGVKGCTAALYNMCVEPDGQVIPCQSYYQTLGHILQDSWFSIWNHHLAVRLRERTNLPPSCTGCALLAECGGGCPLKWATDASS